MREISCLMSILIFFLETVVLERLIIRTKVIMGIISIKKSFDEVFFSDFQKARFQSIVDEILERGKEYILGVEEHQYTDYLYQKYLLEPLTILKDAIEFDEPRKSKKIIRRYDDEWEIDVFTFTVKYRFSGTAELFRVHTNPWTMTSYDIKVDDLHKVVSYNFDIYKTEAEEFHSTNEQCYRSALANVENANKNAEEYNNNLKEGIITAFQNEKGKLLKENAFYEAIRLKVNPNTASIFSVPTVVKKTIPQPVV